MDVKIENGPVGNTGEAGVPVIGVVGNCERLNVRRAPRKDAAVITIIPEDTELKVLGDSRDGEWYKVHMDDGTKGWCMKQYIIVC